MDLFHGQKKNGGIYDRNAKDFLTLVSPDYLGAIYKVAFSSNNKFILIRINPFKPLHTSWFHICLYIGENLGI